MKRLRFSDHAADLGIQVSGKTLEELFENGARALFDLIADLKDIREEEERNITADGLDLDDLWVNYLRECLYLYHGETLLMSDCRITAMTGQRVAATLKGEFLDPARHEMRQDIKAVTYDQATVQETPQGFRGKVILDV